MNPDPGRQTRTFLRPRAPRRWRWLPASAWLLATAACQAPAPPAAPSATLALARVELSGPAIIAFLPPEAQQPGYEGAAEAVGHVRFAMSDTRQCIGDDKPVQMTTVFADRLTLVDGAVQRTIELRDLGHGQGIGAVLAEPGRQQKMIVAEVGASSLGHLLPQAAFEYWRLPACRRD